MLYANNEMSYENKTIHDFDLIYEFFSNMEWQKLGCHLETANALSFIDTLQKG